MKDYLIAFFQVFFWILALITIKTLKFTKRIMPERGKLLRRISLEFQVLSNLFKFVSYCILFILTRLVACYNLCLRKRTVAWLSFTFMLQLFHLIIYLAYQIIVSLTVLSYNIFQLCFDSLLDCGFLCVYRKCETAKLHRMHIIRKYM